MKAILLSIKPEYVDRILAGTKKYEYRKRLARSDSSVLLVYSTSPVMKVVAKVEILGTICAAPSTLWEQTKSNAGISRKKYREYFHGCKTEIFDPPRDLLDYNITLAPQSFSYVDIE